MNRRPWLIGFTAGLAGLLLGAVVLAFTVGPRLQSPAQAVADAAPPPATPVTVLVESRVLTEELIARGTVERQPGAPVFLPVAPGPAAVVTATPVDAGDKLEEGDVLVEVAGRPVVGLQGAFPSYRDLTGGVGGPDVAMLQESLLRLGYEVEVDSVFGAETQAAITDFYEDRGYEPLPGLPDAAQQIKTAQQQVENAEVAVRAARTADPATRRAASTDLARARDTLSDLQLRGGPSVPAGEVLFVDKLPRTVSLANIKVGDRLEEDVEDAFFELDSTNWLVVVNVPSDRLSLLEVGDSAVAVDELTGEEYPLTLVSIGDATESGDGDPGTPVTFAPNDVLPDAEGRTLRVVIEGQTTSDAVLAVPVTAIFSRPDGSRYVTVIEGERIGEDVPVRTGAVIGGWVEVQADGDKQLDVGEKVLVGYESGVLSPDGESP